MNAKQKFFSRRGIIHKVTAYIKSIFDKKAMEFKFNEENFVNCLHKFVYRLKSVYKKGEIMGGIKEFNKNPSKKN